MVNIMFFQDLLHFLRILRLLDQYYAQQEIAHKCLQTYFMTGI